MLTIPLVKSVSTVSTSPTNRETSAPGSWWLRLSALRRVEFCHQPAAQRVRNLLARSRSGRPRAALPSRPASASSAKVCRRGREAGSPSPAVSAVDDLAPAAAADTATRRPPRTPTAGAMPSEQSPFLFLRSVSQYDTRDALLVCLHVASPLLLLAVELGVFGILRPAAASCVRRLRASRRPARSR